MTVKAVEVTRTKPLAGENENAAVKFNKGGVEVGTM